MCGPSKMEQTMTRFQKTLTALPLATALLGTATHAGSFEDPIVEQPVIAPVAIAPVSDWTGFYGGAQIGYADIDGDADLEGDDAFFGLHAGYDYDFGSFVLGGEIDYDATNVDLNDGAAEIDSVARLKLRGGYDLGNTLIYATAGVAQADTSVGDETGQFIGVGVTHRIGDSYSIGAELLEHRFDDIGGTEGADVDATTFTLRGSYRF